MDSAILKAHIQALKKSDGYKAICDALYSNDLADVVRVAMEALEKSHIPLVVNSKSAKKSKLFREKGNVHYTKGEHKLAILYYNKALACAPMESLEMSTAYSNLSAVLLTIKSFSLCIIACNLSLRMTCPNNIKEKLEKRKAEALNHLEDEQGSKDLMLMDAFIREYVQFNEKRNPDIPCASDSVCVRIVDGIKKVVAAKDIRAGTMVAMERSFVSTHTIKDQLTSCYYCHKMVMLLLPCDNCEALFCSTDCRKQCFEEYHCIECPIVNHLGPIYDSPEVKLMTRTAIRIYCKLGWEEFRVASQQIGEEFLRKSTIREAFDVNNPLSLLAYDDQKAVFPGKIFNGSIICGTIISLMSRVWGFFPKEPEERKQAIAAISRLMLHLYATYTNKIEIFCSAFDFQSNCYRCGVQRNVGWFSFTGKLPHSCEPSLFVLGLNEEVALVALKRINKGEELTISYVEQFYDRETFHNLINVRQMRILSTIRYLCECRVCVEKWDINSDKAGALTRYQRRALDDMNKSKKKRFNLRAAAKCLDALTGLLNTTEHKMAYKNLRTALNLCQCAKVMNKTYDGTSVYYI